MAGTTISNLPSASALDGTELFEIVQGGVSHKVALSTIKNWIIPFAERFTVQADWEFDDSTSSSDPGSGKFRVNNSNQSIATFIYISEETKNQSINYSNIINSFTTNDRIYVQNKENNNQWQTYRVNGTVIDEGTWHRIPVVNEDSGNSISDGKECGFVFYFSGA